jgi:hypothetical protein
VLLELAGQLVAERLAPRLRLRSPNLRAPQGPGLGPAQSELFAGCGDAA